ncbi:hypothetical protein OESDEN_10145 [Oesophagostomum dentatum]|uniref:Peptidase M1 membrane alanine aminopeptidase domain-containing protein n=1 Tax=Oesophagostomum dentatum TaxID=61180 RepID=A0A0B1T2K2_OESDE|nr:hypothetical protein OESDEN_10145 [Oesophagostomum dentatum]
MEKYLEYSLMVMAGTIDFMSTYFDYPYPLKKLDMVALPQHANRGAMENWGLTLGHYELLSYDPDYADVAKMAKVGNVVAHETVHMWFGDLVSIDWWSETFLKEGFAEYWAANAHAYADSKQANYTLDFNHFQVHRDAVEFDCMLEHSKPIISDTYPILGKMPYYKGSAMLNLLSNTLRPATLQKGLRRFIKKRAFGASNTEDLWASLTEACAEDGVKDWEGKNLDVSKLMREWFHEKSFPILKVSANNKGQVTYEQTSCLGTNTTWTIPVIRGDGKSESEPLCI